MRNNVIHTIGGGFSRSCRDAALAAGAAGLTLALWFAPASAQAPNQYAPPDLVNLSFETSADLELLKGGGADFPGAYHTLDATGGRNGSRAIRIAIDQRYSNNFEPVGPVWPQRGRVFLRWYFRTDKVPRGNVKGFRFHANHSNLGEVYGGLPCWSFDWEPEDGIGACFDAGMYYGPAPANEKATGRVTCEHLADGAWHWIEVDYDRNAGPNAEVRLWCDGKAVVFPAGAMPRYGPDTYTTVQWIGGSRESNTPTTWRVRRGSMPEARNYTSGVYIWPTISQASGTATVWVDDVAASSQRIGP